MTRHKPFEALKHAAEIARIEVEIEGKIEDALPSTAVAGTRYDEHQMRVLDSEREGAST